MYSFQHHKTIKNNSHSQIFVKDYPKKLHFIFPTAAFDKEWAALTASFFRSPTCFSRIMPTRADGWAEHGECLA